jgi:hypothetical protein
VTSLQLAIWTLFGAGALLFAIALGDRWARQQVPPSPAPGPPARPLLTLALIALACAALRIPWAAGRTLRNTDEHWYAVTAEFGSATGEGVFATPTVLRGIVFAHGLGGFAFVDLLTSLLVGATGFLLGLACWRALGRARAAWLCPPLYALGVLPHEGLSSNSELYVAFCLAAWLCARLGHPDRELLPRAPRRLLLSGACLGAAALAKEQAIPFLLLEPLATLVELRRQGAWNGRAFVRDSALAAAGYWIPLTLYLAGFAWAGTLGTFCERILDWGTTGGHANAFHVSEDLPLDMALLEFMAANFALYLNPVGLLGLAGALRAALEAGRLGEAQARFSLALAAALLGALGVIAIGFHWLPHYFVLAFPALVPLAALRLADLPFEVRRKKLRVPASLLVGLVLLVGVRQVDALIGYPRLATGASLDEAAASRLERLAQAVDARAPEGPLLVWGWRPEVYTASQRVPATRYRVNWLLRVPNEAILADLERYPPAAVVLPHGEGILYSPEDDPFALRRHPQLADWLVRHGYREVWRESPEGYRLLVAEGD